METKEKNNLPKHLLKIKDKILHWDGLWLVHEPTGNTDPRIDVLKIHYDDGEFRWRSFVSREFYEDTEIFWAYIKRKVEELKKTKL